MRSTLISVLLAVMATTAAPALLCAQEGADASLVYHREVFRYPRGQRPDPFRSLLSPEDLGYRIEDLSLTGIIFSPDGNRSVAVLSEVGSTKRFRLRVGQRVGGVTIAAIFPRRVDVIVNEFGVIRRETLQLRRPEIVSQGESEPGEPPAPAQKSAPRTAVGTQKGSER